MAKRNESLLEVLAVVPWWVGVSGAGMIYLFSHFILPAIEFENIALKGIAPNAAVIGNIFVMIFLVGAGLSVINSITKKERLESQTGIESIRALGWKEFEELIGEAYRRKGFAVQENTDAGPDGGVDLWLRKAGKLVLVQCKHWKSNKVGVKVVREHFGVMNAEAASRGVVVSSGSYTSEARKFAKGKALELIDGEQLLQMIREVQKSPKIESNQATEVSTPLCPKCGREMVIRTAKKGRNKGQQFWGCSDFPRCRSVVNIR